ncbi:MAG: hypothetical protein RIC55_16880 [Pirellulaceae bacterium]
MAAASPSSIDRQWFIVGRWQEYEGESRANLLRIVALGVFYAIQLIQYYGFSAQTEADQKFHTGVTTLAIAWTLLAVAVMLCLKRRIFPAALKYVSTLVDVCLLTAAATLADSPATVPFIMAYFLIIAMAGLRFSIPLVWFAAGMSMLAYVYLVGATDDSWFDANHAVPVSQQLVVLASLGLTGILLGQILRRVRTLAEDFARRLRAHGEG